MPAKKFSAAALYENAGRQLAYALDERRKAAAMMRDRGLGIRAAAPFLVAEEKHRKQAERFAYRAMARERSEQKRKR